MVAGKSTQRVFGVLLVAVSVYFTWQQWHTALTAGYFYDKAAAVFPAFCFLGIGLVLFPIDKSRLLEKYGTQKITGWQQFPLAWKVIVIMGVLAGFANYLLLKGDISI